MRVLACWLLLGAVVGAETPAPDARFFELQIRPLLVEHCQSCHGPKKQMAGLRLDSKAAFLKGGESGPAFDPKTPANSLFLTVIGHTGTVKMPPKYRLPASAIAALSHWVQGGAPWPDAGPAPTADARTHWAFQPIQAPTVPPLHGAQIVNDIDRFIAAKRATKGLTASPPAERATLIRRLTFDLTGLPPTPEEVAEYVASKDPQATEQLVTRLLQSPAYGEHFGRMWLDVARYADTKGYVFFEEANYPWAWTYRDYVIEAFNKDLPYNRFVLEQIAADQLVGEQQPALRALGFLTVGGRFMNNVHDIIDDRIDVVTRGLLGLTVSCARCHDHKFDPIPASDYYSLYGVFASSDEPAVQPLFAPPPMTEVYAKFATEMTQRENKLRAYVQLKRNELAAGARRRAAEYLLAAHANRDKPGQEEFMLIADGNDLNPKMIVRWQSYMQHTRRTGHAVFALWHALAAVPEAEFAAQASTIIAAMRQTNTHAVLADLYTTVPKNMAELANHYSMLLQRGQAILDSAPLIGPSVLVLNAAPQQLLWEVLRSPDYPPNVTVGDYGDLDLLPDRPSQAEVQKLRKEVEQWRNTGPGAPPRAMALRDAPTPQPARVFQRGNPYNLGPQVPRQFLSCLAPQRKPFVQGSGRLELAQAIVDPKNPLTARVLVNRIWQQLFGRGLVPTPGDFGVRGEAPTHPELLDYLATTLIADGWSVKRLVTRMVMSATYQQQSADRVEASAIDPDNLLWWRANRRRLGFEGMRDSLLAVSGKLDRTVGGPSVHNFLVNQATRRTLYGHLDRLNVPGVYRTFDFPAPDATAAKRELTTVPPQALFMMNHPFVEESAKNVLARPDVAKENAPANKLTRIYALLFSRTPIDREQALAKTYLEKDPRQAWPKLVHALLMTNEFMFVD